MVLVDQSVQELPATDRPLSFRRVRLGRPQSESQMGTLAVVVLGVLIKDNPQVLFAEDEQPVQRFVPEGLDHALTMGVGSRSPIGREHNLGAFGPEDLVEVVDEFGVTIVNRELNRNL